MDSLTLTTLKNYIVSLFQNKKLAIQLFGAYGAYKVLYYLFLDPLRSVPGPWWARFTEIPYESARFKGDMVVISNKIHKAYGPIARVGPNKVSVSETKDIKLILSTYRYPKDKTYHNTITKHQNIFSTTNEAYNRTRRRQVGPAFTTTGLDTVEDLVMQVGIMSLKNKIDQEIQNDDGEYCMNYFNMFQFATADVIGELAFGKSFDAVANEGHPIIGWSNGSLKSVGLMQAYPILKVFPFLIHSLVRNIKQMHLFTEESAKKRKELIKSDQYHAARVDILQTYTTSLNPDGSKLDDKDIGSEIGVMLVAGTDTTSVTMSWLIHIYTIYPDVYRRVLDEINSNFPDRSKPIRHKEAREKLPYFVATVYECMRLVPAASGALPRESSDKGVQLSTHYIPKDTILMLYPEGAHYNSSTWDSPEKFIPERFLGEEGSIKTKDLLTFSSGVRICPGRNLAWMEILTIIPNLVRDYDIKLPSDAIYTPQNLDPSRYNEPTLLDCKSFLTRVPVNAKRDCNVVLSKKAIIRK